MVGLRRIHEIIQAFQARLSVLRAGGLQWRTPRKVWDAAEAALGLEPSDGLDGRSMTELVRASPERFFSDRFNVTPALMERLLGGSLAGRVDDADIYLEYRVNEELVLEENVVKKASRHVSQGAGVRAQAERAHRLRPHRRHLAPEPRGGRAPGARHRRPRRAPPACSRCRAAGRTTSTRWPSRRSSPTLARKLELLRRIDAAARAADPRVTQVIASAGQRGGRDARSPPPPAGRSATCGRSRGST